MPSRCTRRGSGDGQQQQVELLQRVGHPRQEAARLPPRRGDMPVLAVRALVVVVEEEAPEGRVQLGKRQRRLPARRPGGA